jgi:hypothetical protein
VTRKLNLRGGAAVDALVAELLDITAALRRSNRPGLGATGERLEAGLADLKAAIDYLRQALAEGRQRAALAGATAFLRLFSLCTGGVLLAKGALAEDATNGRFVTLARFFAERILGETAGLRLAVTEGAAALDQAAALLAASD